MPESQIYFRAEERAVRQCEILSDLVQYRILVESIKPNEVPTYQPVTYPYVVVLSQDCDLDRDDKERHSPKPAPDKFLPNVLLCEAVPVEDAKGRIPGGSDIWKKLINNKDERYHLLNAVPAERDAAGQGVVSLILDFKRILTVDTAEVYVRIQDGTVKRRCSLASPYREHLSNRFCYFHQRVALP